MGILSLLSKRMEMPAAGRTLPGRAEPIATAATHFVNHRPLHGPYPEGMATALAAIPGSAGDELLNPPSRPAVNPAAQVLRRQTVRLGVYLTPTQADIAWKSAIRSYTYLVTLPKQVQTVRLGGKGPRYYALNLGTPSRGHAKQLCRNLKAIGYACTVA